MRFIRKRKRKIEKREYQVTVNIPQYDNYNNHPEFSSPWEEKIIRRTVICVMVS